MAGWEEGQQGQGVRELIVGSTTTVLPFDQPFDLCGMKEGPAWPLRASVSASFKGQLWDAIDWEAPLGLAGQI